VTAASQFKEKGARGSKNVSSFLMLCNLIIPISHPMQRKLTFPFFLSSKNLTKDAVLTSQNIHPDSIPTNASATPPVKLASEV
jgi:hypothetical protein